MNIAILGGKFDPPHNGHLLIAEQVLENILNIDEVWLVPANTHPWKEMHASAKHRLAMTRLLTTKRIKVNTIDINRGGDTYTVDTIKELQKSYAHNFIWVVGSDNISSFNRWKDFKHLRNNIPFYVFERVGYGFDKLPKPFKKIKGGKLLINNYSSKAIRLRIKKGLSIKGLVPEKVRQYIIDHHVYTTK